MNNNKTKAWLLRTPAKTRPVFYWKTKKNQSPPCAIAVEEAYRILQSRIHLKFGPIRDDIKRFNLFVETESIA